MQRRRVGRVFALLLFYKIDRIPRKSSIKHPVSGILVDYRCNAFVQIRWPNCKRNDDV